MTRRQRTLIGLFLFLLTTGAILLTIYNFQVSQDLGEALVDQKVEEGRKEVELFREDLEKTMEKYGFMELVDQTRDSFLEFEELSKHLLNTNKYISYVHLKNDRGETLLYKGPKFVHRVTINTDGVSFYSATTGEVREIIVERAGAVEGTTEISTPIHDSGEPMGSIRVGISTDRILAERKVAVDRVRRRTFTYGVMAISLIGVGFLFALVQFRRIEKLEARLDESRHLAELGALASGLVHEIRNPINGVNLNLALLDDEIGESGDRPLRERTQQLLGRIRPSLNHLERLASEFLRYSKPPRPQLVEDSLNAVVRSVTEFVRPQCVQAGVRLQLELDEGLEPFPLDREIIKQVILNFVMNGIQVMTTGGTLTLVTRSTPIGGQLEVRDSGPGMRPQVRERVFDLFFSTREGGVGLGLPIARRLVESHEGRVWVESVEGQGATFAFELPRKIPEELGDGSIGKGEPRSTGVPS